MAQKFSTRLDATTPTNKLKSFRPAERKALAWLMCSSGFSLDDVVVMFLRFAGLRQRVLVPRCTTRGLGLMMSPNRCRFVGGFVRVPAQEDSPICVYFS